MARLPRANRLVIRNGKRPLAPWAVLALAVVAFADPARAAYIGEVWLPGNGQPAAVEVAGFDQPPAGDYQLVVANARYADRPILGTYEIDAGSDPELLATDAAPFPALSPKPPEDPDHPDVVSSLELGPGDPLKRTLLLTRGLSAWVGKDLGDLEDTLPQRDLDDADATLHDAVTFSRSGDPGSTAPGLPFETTATPYGDGTKPLESEPRVNAGPGDMLLHHLDQPGSPTGTYASGALNSDDQLIDLQADLRYEANPGLANETPQTYKAPAPTSLAGLLSPLTALWSLKRGPRVSQNGVR